MSDRLSLPFGFTNTTRRVDATVVKEFEGRGAKDRWATEVAALADVAGLLPVPQIVETFEEPPTLRTAFIESEPASMHLTDYVLYEMGALLRDFQAAYRSKNGRMVMAA